MKSNPPFIQTKSGFFKVFVPLTGIPFGLIMGFSMDNMRDGIVAALIGGPIFAFVWTKLMWKFYQKSSKRD
jgi:hypothetical protein